MPQHRRRGAGAGARFVAGRVGIAATTAAAGAALASGVLWASPCGFSSWPASLPFAARRSLRPAQLVARRVLPEDADGQSLLAWLSSEGAAVEPGLKLVVRPPLGRELVVDTDVEEGCELIRLPAELCLPAPPTIERGEEEGPPPPEDVRLAAALLGAEGEERWAAYRAVWPSEAELADMLPVFWEDRRLEKLAARFPGLSAQVASRRELLSQAAKRLGLCGEGGEEDSAAVKRLRRAHALVSTRAVGAGIDACAMLPGIDMANHDVAPNAELVVAGEPGIATGRATVTSRGDVWEHGSAGLVAKRDIAAGEAVRISYGLYPNQRLLLDYGFELGESNLKGDREEEAPQNHGGRDPESASAWDRAD